MPSRWRPGTTRRRPAAAAPTKPTGSGALARSIVSRKSYTAMRLARAAMAWCSVPARHTMPRVRFRLTLLRAHVPPRPLVATSRAWRSCFFMNRGRHHGRVVRQTFDQFAERQHRPGLSSHDARNDARRRVDGEGLVQRAEQPLGQTVQCRNRRDAELRVAAERRAPVRRADRMLRWRPARCRGQACRANQWPRRRAPVRRSPPDARPASARARRRWRPARASPRRGPAGSRRGLRPRP